MIDWNARRFSGVNMLCACALCAVLAASVIATEPLAKMYFVNNDFAHHHYTVGGKNLRADTNNIYSTPLS